MKHWKLLLILPLLLLSCIYTMAQNHVNCSLSNCAQTGTNKLQFDLYVTNDGTTALKLNSAAYGININTSILGNTGNFPAGDTLVCTYVGDSEIPSGILSLSLSYFNSGSIRQVKVTTLPGPVTSSNAPTLTTN